MHAEILSDAYLDGMRNRGDPPADNLIQAIAEHYGDAGLAQLLNIFEGIIRIPVRADLDSALRQLKLPPNLRSRLENFLDQTALPPSWLNAEQLKLGETVFREFTFLAFVVLGCASLPYCYSWRDEARILGITGKLERDVPRRIPRTAQLIIDVMRRGGMHFTPSDLGTGVRAALKVRLIHAIIRHLLNRPADPESDLVNIRPDSMFYDYLRVGPASFGLRDTVMLNQEQLCCTLLTFSHVIIRGLSRIGVRLSVAEREAFQHSWNVMGHVLGIDETVLLALRDYDSTAALFEKLVARNRGDTPDGRALIEALLGYMGRNIERLAPFCDLFRLRYAPRLIVTKLIDAQTAATLGLRLGVAARVMRFFVWLVLRVAGRTSRWWLARSISQWLFKLLSRYLWDWGTRAPQTRREPRPVISEDLVAYWKLKPDSAPSP